MPPDCLLTCGPGCRGRCTEPDVAGLDRHLTFANARIIAGHKVVLAIPLQS